MEEERGAKGKGMKGKEKEEKGSVEVIRGQRGRGSERKKGEDEGWKVKKEEM